MNIEPLPPKITAKTYHAYGYTKQLDENETWARHIEDWFVKQTVPFAAPGRKVVVYVPITAYRTLNFESASYRFPTAECVKIDIQY